MIISPESMMNGKIYRKVKMNFKYLMSKNNNELGKTFCVLTVMYFIYIYI